MHWVYHPIEGSKIVSSEEYDVLLASGWYDTPAAFPSTGMAAQEDTAKLEQPAKKLNGVSKKKD